MERSRGTRLLLRGRFCSTGLNGEVDVFDIMCVKFDLLEWIGGGKSGAMDLRNNQLHGTTNPHLTELDR